MRVINHHLPLLKAAGKYCQAYLNRQRLPLYIGLLLTQRCNLQCIYCFPDSPHRGKETELPAREIFRIVDQLYDMGTRYIALLGGEPLIREDFDEIIHYIAQKNIITEVITNGWFTRRKLSGLKNAGFVCHSIDGDKTAMEKNRGPGSHKKIMESLQLCKQEGIPVQLRTVFNKNNAHCLEYLLDMAKQYRTTLGVCEQAVIRDTDRDAAMTPAELKQFWKRVKQRKQEGGPIDKTLRQLDRIIRYPLDLPLDKIFRAADGVPAAMDYQNCHIANGHAFIDSNGVMYPCATLLGKQQGGYSIYEAGGIAGAWEMMGSNDCRFCRQSIQDLKSEFFSYDAAALKTVSSSIIGKIRATKR